MLNTTTGCSSSAFLTGLCLLLSIHMEFQTELWDLCHLITLAVITNNLRCIQMNMTLSLCFSGCLLAAEQVLKAILRYSNLLKLICLTGLQTIAYFTHSADTLAFIWTVFLSNWWISPILTLLWVWCGAGRGRIVYLGWWGCREWTKTGKLQVAKPKLWTERCYKEKNLLVHHNEQHQHYRWFLTQMNAALSTLTSAIKCTNK